MHFLNELYEVFDELVDNYNMYKLDTVGDCYIVVAGLIKEDQDGFACVNDMDEEQVMQHAGRILAFAKAMLRESKTVRALPALPCLAVPLLFAVCAAGKMDCVRLV